MCRAADPMLFTVMAWAVLVAPCVTTPNDKVDGVTLIADLDIGWPVPLPLSWTDCGESGASSVIRMAAERSPEPKGAKFTSMVQFALTDNAAAHVFLTKLKSFGFEPLSRTEEICSVARPALVRVTRCDPLALP